MIRKNKIFILLCCLFCWMWAAADPIHTTVGSGSICPGDEIVIPVTVSNCNGVAAISLTLNFDATKVSYQGYQNLNSTVSTMLVNSIGGSVYMSWAGMNAVNVSDGTLVELRFTGINGNTNLNWNTGQCEYSDVTGTALQANYQNGSVNVYALPHITSNPTNHNLTTGQSTTFEVSASGQGLSYQWQIKTAADNEWQVLGSDSHHSNVNYWRLNVNDVTMEMDGNQYRCIVSGTCGSPVTSNSATLTVQQYIPTIVTSVGSASSCANEVFSVPVTVTNCNNVGAISLSLNYNSSLVTYLGYENVNPQLSNGSVRVNAANGVAYFIWASSNQTLEIGNGQLISFVFRSLSGSSSLSWNVGNSEYSNMAGQALPASFNGSNLNIYYAPSINSHPSDRTVAEGQNTNFSVSASGQGLSYQWQMSQDQGISWETLSNGGHYSNVTSSTLYVNNVQTSMEGLRYRCVVNGTCDPSATSNYATLHVQSYIPTIVTTVGSLNSCSQTEFGIPVSVTNCNNVGAISLTLSYNSNILTYSGYEGLNPALGNGQLQVNASNGKVYIAWASIEGTSIGNGNLLTINFTAQTTGTSSLTWSTNYCEYANPQGVAYPASYNNGNVTVGDMSFSITTQPLSHSVTMEENTTFSVATSGPTTGYQWQVSQNGGASWSNISLGGHYANPTTSTLSINNVPIEMNGYRYRCVISGSCGVQYSSVAILTVQLPPNYYEITLAADPVEGGTVAGAGAYMENMSCTVTATPATGYTFVNWTENGTPVSTDTSYTFTVGADCDLVAHFTLQELSIVVNVVPAGGGTINGGGTYLYGDHVLLTAIPATGYRFENWTENGSVISTNQSISFTAQTDRTLEANFSVLQVSITAIPVPVSNGSVEGTGVFTYGTQVVLIAHPEEGFELANWTENGTVVSMNDTLSFMAETDRNLEAHFIVQSLNITAVADPEGSGIITGAGTYNYGDPVVLTAIPQGDFEFYNWTENGEEVSTNATFSFTANTNRNLVAHFYRTITIVAVVNPEEGGVVNGSGTYNYLDPITLTATPITGYTFVNWTENDTVFSTQNAISFTALVDRSFVANFEIIQVDITAVANPEEGGNVTGMGLYDYGEQVVLYANPAGGYEFSSWTENGTIVSTNAIYAFTARFDRNLVAEFSMVTYQVTATANPSNGGQVTGGGVYHYGDECTLTATPNEEFIFLNWTQNGNIVSTNATYSFTAIENGHYVAHFVRALPELHVTGITHSSLVGGQQATISWTVQNNGTAATPNGAMWNDRVWLSVESRVAAGDNNPILLGTFENISALDVGEYYTQTQTFNIPLEVSGDYFLFVLTDAYDAYQIFWENNEVPIPYNPPPYIGCLSHHCPSGCPNVSDNRIYELSEYEHGDNPGLYYNDNFFYELVDIEVPLVPDLQVTSIISPDNFFSGTNINVTATICNLGEVTTPNANWTDALYFSQTPDFNTATCLATVAHSGALAVDSSYQVTFTGHIPLTIFGEAYFFVKTDIYEQVYEHINNHNNMTMSNPVNIILTPPADLEPSELVVPVAVSTAENLSYSFKVTNVGAGNPNVTSWVDKVYISTEDTFGANTILLNTHYHYGNLAPSAYYSINGSVSLPSSVNSGFYYVYVVTDATDAVFEYLYEDNNVIQSSLISVTSPDLQITEMTAPEQIISGYPINMSYTLINNGDGAIINRNITDRIFLSASGNLSNAFEIANMRHNVNLPVGQSMTVTCNATAPTNLTDGTFHLIVVADGNNEIHESNEGNNTLSQYPVPVMHQPLPDLHPVSFNLPSTIQAGEAVNVDFDITNLGDLDLLNSNCTFNMYALMGNNEILCPVQSQTLPLGSNVSIGIGQTVHFVRSILVPASVTSACTTFKLYADKENRVTESNESNNTITANASVIDCPLPDLTVSNFMFPALQAGTEAQVSFTVSNQGTADFNGSFSTAIYANASGTQILCPLRQQIAPETTNYSLAVGESLQFSLKVLVPPTVTSACNSFSVKVDEANAVLETNENNNSVNGSASVTNYPFNLTTQNFVVPSTITAGESTSVSWTVKNTGTCPNGQIPFYIRNGGGYALVEGEYLPTPWKDRIYLSDDASLSNNDIQLLADDHNTVLHPNGTYSVEQTVTLPYSTVGLKYLLCVSDASELTFDNNRSDNVVVVPVTVELGTLPDLHFTALTVEPVMTSDNAYWVHYTVTNEGERVTQRDNWMDAFYIGQTYAVAGAFQLGSKIHNGALAVGASYTDSIEIVLPSSLNGDYFMLGYTDATNLVFENTNESNNLHGVTVTVVAPDPCDLIAIQPEFPNYAVSGEEMTVSWQLRNIGANPAVGRVRNAVYLSTDAAWSSDDVMLGYANVDINIAANQQQVCSLSGSLTGIAEGNYYVIVKANILNALNESSYENNICVSLLTTEVGFPLLAIGEQVDRPMTSDQYIYYKLQVGPEYEGQTLSCTLTTAEEQVANGIYLSHEAVPTLSQYDFGKYAPYAQEIEILIPSLEQGDYYLLAKGSTQNSSLQQIHIATSIINFEILHIDADHGSNTGSITTKVTGAKFDSIMDFRLVQGGDYLPAEKVFFSNSTETYTTFDLVDMPTGTYAIEAELPGGIITIKGEAFTIEEGLPAELAVNIVAPSSVRRGNTFPVNIEYGNIGTTDLNVSGFVVVSRNGHPIGFTSDELAEGLTERVFSTAEANGNPDVLRPGYRATKTILVDANTLTSVSLQVYAIRKQY